MPHMLERQNERSVQEMEHHYDRLVRGSPVAPSLQLQQTAHLEDLTKRYPTLLLRCAQTPIRDEE
jgi:hypothetical protein